MLEALTGFGVPSFGHVWIRDFCELSGTWLSYVILPHSQSSSEIPLSSQSANTEWTCIWELRGELETEYLWGLL